MRWPAPVGAVVDGGVLAGRAIRRSSTARPIRPCVLREGAVPPAQVRACRRERVPEPARLAPTGAIRQAQEFGVHLSQEHRLHGHPYRRRSYPGRHLPPRRSTRSAGSTVTPTTSVACSCIVVGALGVAVDGEEAESALSGHPDAAGVRPRCQRNVTAPSATARRPADEIVGHHQLQGIGVLRRAPVRRPSCRSNARRPFSGSPSRECITVPVSTSTGPSHVLDHLADGCRIHLGLWRRPREAPVAAAVAGSSRRRTRAW